MEIKALLNKINCPIGNFIPPVIKTNIFNLPPRPFPLASERRQEGLRERRLEENERFFSLTITGLNMGRRVGPKGPQAGRALVICAARGARDQGGVAPCRVSDPHPPGKPEIGDQEEI